MAGCFTFRSVAEGLVTYQGWAKEAEKIEGEYNRGLSAPIATDLRKSLAVLTSRTFTLLSAFIARKPKINQNHAHELVFHYLLARGMKTYRSITILWQSGNEQDAMALLRNLLETVITLKYMTAEDVDYRVKRFTDFQHCECRKRLNTYKGLLKSKSIHQRDYDEAFPSAAHVKLVEDNYKNHFSTHLTKANSTDSWSGKNALEMAKDPKVNMVHDYLTAFKSFSLFTHPTSLAVKDYIRNGYLGWLPSWEQINTIGLLSTKYVLDLMKIYCSALGINIPKEVTLQIEINIAKRLQAGGQEINGLSADFNPETWYFPPPV